jgi:hypothetical protein
MTDQCGDEVGTGDVDWSRGNGALLLVCASRAATSSHALCTHTDGPVVDGATLVSVPVRACDPVAENEAMHAVAG